MIHNVAATDYNFLDNEVTVRMISNYEWAATAFLANSYYGVESSGVYAADAKTGLIKKYVVGYEKKNNAVIPLTSLVTLPTSDVYHSEESVFASSTRNVTGVYGLSGGAEEWVSDQESHLKTVYNTDAASLGSTKGRLDSYSTTYDINDQQGYCLARGGNLNKNGLFAYDFYPCTYNLSSRIVVK